MPWRRGRGIERRHGANDVDYYAEPLRDEIDALNETIYENVNNGVYKAGFVTSQEAYEEPASFRSGRKWT